MEEVKRIALSLLISCIYLLGLTMGDSAQVGWGDREVSSSYSGFCEVEYRSAMRPSQEPTTQWIPSTTSALTIGAANTAFNAAVNTDFLMPSGGGTFVAGVVLKSKSLNLLRQGLQAESQVANVAAKSVSKLDGIPLTGVAKYDQLAVGSKYFDSFISGVKSRGFRVSCNPNLMERANLRLGQNKMIFEYNPKTFNVLDMRHEIQHFNQFKQYGRSMFDNIPAMERGAYGFELNLGGKAGFSSDYMD